MTDSVKVDPDKQMDTKAPETLNKWLVVKLPKGRKVEVGVGKFGVDWFLTLKKLGAWLDSAVRK